MYCNSDFHTGICPAKKKNGECVSQFPCKHQVVPPTNADRIRSMSDEELAEWMAECNAYKEYADSSQWLSWLQQTVKE